MSEVKVAPTAESDALDGRQELDIMFSTCELCSKSCSIWSISMNKYIFIGVWDCSTHRIMSFCSNDCMKLWHSLHDKL